MDREISIPHSPGDVGGSTGMAFTCVGYPRDAAGWDAWRGRPCPGIPAGALRCAAGIGLDRDPACIAAAQVWGQEVGSRFVAVNGDFREMTTHLAQLNTPQVDAVLLDLGVSSYQLDTAERGV